MRSLGSSGVLVRAIIIGLGLQSAVAVAEQSPPRVTLSSPQQPLRDALNALARETGLQIVYTADDVASGFTAPHVQGQFTVEEALNALLKGTSLTFEFLNPRTVLVKASRAESSQAGAADAGTIETVNVFATLDSQLEIGSKTGQSLRETPKSVTLVTRERIETQNLTSLADALNQTTGITLAGYSSVESFWMSRGFRLTTMQLDGGAPAISTGFGSWLQPDMAVYDHVEVLRGVDGMYTGAGEPGGVINLVRKRAKRATEIQASASLGSWDFRRAEFDLTGPLTEDGRLRGRAVAAYQDTGYFYDRGQSEKVIFFGTGEYDLTPTTLLVAGANYERRKEDAYFTSGMPRYAAGGDLGLSRDTAFNPDWNHWYFTTKEVFARVEQQFGRNGVVKLNLTRLQQDSESRFMTVFGAVDPETLTGPIAVGRAYDFGSVQQLADLSASGTFELFGHEHRYTVGADYAKADGGGQRAYALQGYSWAGETPVDVFHFDPAQYPRPAAILSGYYPLSEQSQHGFYATVGLQLADALRLTLGGRYGEYRFAESYQDVDASGVYSAPTTTRYEDSKFIPSVALTWDFAADWSAYASYAETFKVQANMLSGPKPGRPLDPLTGAGYELGVKGEVFGFLNTALAVYRIERTGQAVRDLAYPYEPGASGSSCCYLPQADITSEGVDVEASGTVLPGWQLFAGYTYNKSKLAGAPSLYESYFLNLTPRHMFKLWTSWQLPGRFSHWTFNAGVLAQSESLVNGGAFDAVTGDYVSFRFSQGTYSTWNASLQYRFDDTWSLGLYGDNLFDKTYYASVGDVFTDNVYGTPRSFVLSLRARW